MADVVCIGAHPDDVEIGMGGTIAGMVRRGVSVAIVDLTDGEPTPHGTPELRREEAARAAEILGAERYTLTQANRYLFDTVEAREELAEVLRELRPSTMFVPFPEDAHPDHIAAASIATGARFYAKLTKTEMRGDPHYPERLYRYMAVHLRLVREPSFVVDIAEDLETKLAALMAYESQFMANEKNREIIEMMRMQALMWGGMIRGVAGEPFFAEEPIGLQTPIDLI